MARQRSRYLTTAECQKFDRATPALGATADASARPVRKADALVRTSEFLPAGEGRPPFELIGPSSFPAIPQPVAAGTENDVSCWVPPLLKMANITPVGSGVPFPSKDSVLTTGLVAFSGWSTIGFAFVP